MSTYNLLPVHYPVVLVLLMLVLNLNSALNLADLFRVMIVTLKYDELRLAKCKVNVEKENEDQTFLTLCKLMLQQVISMFVMPIRLLGILVMEAQDKIHTPVRLRYIN